MLDRFFHETVAFEPGAGATMQGAGCFRMRSIQPETQQLSEQMMITVPLPHVVQRDDEKIGAFQMLERGLGISDFGWWIAEDGISLRNSRPEIRRQNRIAQVATKSIQNRSLQQKILHGLGLALEDFFHEIIEDITIIAGKSLDAGCAGSTRPIRWFWRSQPERR